MLSGVRRCAPGSPRRWRLATRSAFARISPTGGGDEPPMTLGVSLLLVAAGAILIWGVTGEASGIDVDAIGVILIVVGIIGFVLSLVFWERWGWGGPTRRRTAYV